MQALTREKTGAVKIEANLEKQCLDENEYVLLIYFVLCALIIL
jgi:hypothetical protein